MDKKELYKQGDVLQHKLLGKCIVYERLSWNYKLGTFRYTIRLKDGLLLDVIQEELKSEIQEKEEDNE